VTNLPDDDAARGLIDKAGKRPSSGVDLTSTGVSLVNGCLAEKHERKVAIGRLEWIQIDCTDPLSRFSGTTCEPRGRSTMNNEAPQARRVVGVGEAEQSRAIDAIVMAFAFDPVIRWFYREAWRYLAHYGHFVGAFGGQAFGEGTAWSLDDFAATAIWLPPTSRLNDETIVCHLESTVQAEYLVDLFEVIGQMDAGHPPEPHWYLAWLGVDPAMQGRGLGNELLASCLSVVDADHAPAYLDNTNPANVPFYERHGFRVIGESHAGACPPLKGMIRDAR